MNLSPHLPPIDQRGDNRVTTMDASESSETVKRHEDLMTPLDSYKLAASRMRLIHDKNERILETIREKMSKIPENEFGLSADDLGRICNFDERNSIDLVESLDKQYGGVQGIICYVRADQEKGLKLIKSDEKAGKVVTDAAERKKCFGENKIPPPPSESIFQLIIGQIQEDIILKVLLVGAAVVISLGTALCPKTGWVEGMAILVAVVIVLAVTSGNDWSKDRKFKKLLLMQSEKKVKVIRDGVKDQISSWDVLVGDLIELAPGDEVPVDGLFVSGSRLIIDESPLTGESLPVKKSAKEPFLFSGCQVSEGSAIMLSTGVGEKSCGGQIQKILNEAQKEETVLQEKLKVVAVQIGKVGVAAGIVTFLVLAIRWAVFWAQGKPGNVESCSGAPTSEVLARLQELAEHFVIGITVVVVAVPEGLPLAVTISLAFSMFKMIQDKCFVRHLSASETMGQATCICTDKTGTLTENRMTVVRAMVSNVEYNGEGSAVPGAVPYSENTFPTAARDLLAESISANSTCFVKYKEGSPLPVFVGSATEGSMLVFVNKLGCNYDEIRKKVIQVEGGVWPFSSERKRMSTLVEPIAPTPDIEEHQYRLYSKGASEIVLNLCTTMVNPECTQVVPILPVTRVELQTKIKEWAGEGLRTIAVAYKNSDQKIITVEGRKSDDPEHDLTLIGLLAIKDPIRKEVPGAVAQCQKAGLTIKMVTGDNILTACKIARECNILTDGVAMEGPIFRSLSDFEKRKVAPQLQVLARSSPTDKFILVSLLREMGQVVAVTGDGTNDAPALKEADVGFAMGISGTQIAMNASDIVLLDDNFVSLVQSIKWGRNVLDSVRKFLQFQLGVNLIAIILTVVGSAVKGQSPLNTVQLLWVNLIMDSLGALALASDEPDPKILDRPPHPRTESLISKQMKRYILCQCIYQIITLVGIYLGLDVWKPVPGTVVYTNTITKDKTFDISETTSWGTNVETSTVYYDHEHITPRTRSVVFTTFVLLQVFNLIMSRQLDGQLNVLRRFFKNYLFVIISALIVLIQLIVTILGQTFIQTTTMDGVEWAIIVGISAGSVPVIMLFRLAFIIYDKSKKRTGAMNKMTIAPEKPEKSEVSLNSDIKRAE